MSYVKKESVEDVLRAERAHILDGEKDEGKGRDLCGLALSGGGIRSASFGMGVLQALAKADLLKKIDYLSTVSGGGYIGSSLTWFLSRKDSAGSSLFGTGPETFPFGNIGRDRTTRFNKVLNFIRQHGNYLVPDKELNGLSLLGVALRVTSVSLFVYLSLLTVAMTIFHGLGWFEKMGRLPNLFLGLAALGVLVFFFWSVAHAVGTVALKSGLPERRYRWRISIQIWLGRVLAFLVSAFVLGWLPLIHSGLSRLTALVRMEGAEVVLSALLTIVGGIIGFLHERRCHAAEKSGEHEGSARIVVGALLFLFGLLLTAYFFSTFLTACGAIVLGVAALLVGWFVNTNYFGVHRMYRDRLMELFLPNVDAVDKNQWGEATDADRAPIERMCQSPNRRPYHLVNTHIVLVDSKQSEYRGGENFILSPLYCGSVATGWCRSEGYMKERGGMTLATAMAISGAAVNPNAGVAGKGPTTHRLVSTLMSLLNIRTGYWAENPNPETLSCCTPKAPNFLSPGLRGGILSGGLREDQDMIELTDGGHFENLGLYELIRRQIKLMIVSDGSADPAFHFDDLGNATERARVDFGALIEFDRTDYPLRDILPKTDEGDPVLREKYDLAKHGFAVGRIRYPDETGNYTPENEGTLIYLKATMIAGLPQDIYSYKSDHPSFPDQSTADQFFDETQFEAYRELGYFVTKKMLAANARTGNRWIR